MADTELGPSVKSTSAECSLCDSPAYLVVRTSSFRPLSAKIGMWRDILEIVVLRTV